MSRVRLQAIIRDEAGNKLAGTGYEVRFYVAGTNTLATLWPDAVSGSTIPNPHYPNAGMEYALSANTAAVDTVIGLNSVSGLSTGDFITFDDGVVRTERVIISINTGAVQITLSAAIGRIYLITGPATRVNGRENRGHVATYIDNSADIELTVKNLATSVEGPRELYLIKPVSDWVKIAESLIAGASVASVTFSSIPGTYRHLCLIYEGLTTSATNGQDFLQAQANGDTAANYAGERFTAAAAVATPADVAAATQLNVGILMGGGSPAGAAGAGEIWIPNYAQTTFHKWFRGTVGSGKDLTAGTRNFDAFAGKWASTAAITSLLLKSSLNNLAIGTILTLYGVN